jgi:DNA-binding transcriptional LysR family regulator
VADELVVVVPSKHEWVGQQVELQYLCKAPLILREKGSGTRRVGEAAPKEAGIQMKHTRVIMELDSRVRFSSIRIVRHGGWRRPKLPPKQASFLAREFYGGPKNILASSAAKAIPFRREYKMGRFT